VCAPVKRSRARAGVLLLAALPALACATAEIAPVAAPPSAAAANPPRSAPDDSDLLGVVPDGAETVIEVDVAQVRASPWSRALVALPDAERATKTDAQGFDEVIDIDRAVFAVSEGAAEPTTLVVAQGRFDEARLAQALHDGWTRGEWRGSRLWLRGDQARALLTARTLITGQRDAVRAAIDCAWSLTPDVRQGPLGGLIRELGGDTTRDTSGGRPAVTAASTVTEAMRRRVEGQFALPAGLQRAAGRLDLGPSLELELVGLLDSERQADETAHNLSTTLRDLRARRALAIFGITPFLNGVTIAPQGNRVRVRLVVPEDKREDLAAKVAFVLEAIRARSASQQ
jgi:hypothetical protein